MIRKAKIEDLRPIAVLAKEVHEQSVYRHLQTDEAVFKKTCAMAIGSKQMFLWVSAVDGEVCGFLLGAVDHIGIPGIKGRQASDILFYVREGGDGIRLAKRFIEWGWQQPNVEMVGMSNSSGIDTERVNRLIEKMGMTPQVTSFLQFKKGDCYE